MTTRFLRFAELKERGIVTNWVTLGNWMAKGGFPPGRKLGPNTTVWTEQEIQQWVDSRPLANRKSDAA
jgi:predicted DNA-binding transcriptional regulator AlpA